MGKVVCDILAHLSHTHPFLVHFSFWIQEARRSNGSLCVCWDGYSAPLSQAPEALGQRWPYLALTNAWYDLAAVSG